MSHLYVRYVTNKYCAAVIVFDGYGDPTAKYATHLRTGDCVRATVLMWGPQYTVCVMVITGGQSSNKVEPSSVIVMLLSVYTHLTNGDHVRGIEFLG